MLLEYEWIFRVLCKCFVRGKKMFSQLVDRIQSTAHWDAHRLGRFKVELYSAKHGRDFLPGTPRQKRDVGYGLFLQ